MTAPVENFMRGPTRLRQIVASFFETEMPPMIDFCRTNWNLTEMYLPYPQKYDAYDPFVGEGNYPLIGMYTVGDNIQRARVDYDAPMATEYQVEYSVRMFCAVASPTDQTGQQTAEPYKDALKLREDMLAVMRMCMLNRNSMGAPGTAYLLEETIQEDYPDAMQSKALGGKYLASGIIAATIRVTERLQLGVLGRADTITTQIVPFDEE